MTFWSAPGWQFDHLASALAPVLNEVLADQRSRCPIIHSDRHGGFWAVLTHDVVRSVALDTDSYSSADGVSIPATLRDTPKPPIAYDPPEHAQLRKIIQKHFTRPAVAEFEPVVRALTRERLGQLIAGGEADLVSGLARYVPPIVIAELMGLPHEDADKFVGWTTDIVRLSATAGDFARERRTVTAFTDYLAAELARQRAAGLDTITTAIADGSLADRPLTEAERIGMILLLVMAGHETTVNGIGTLLYYLATVDGLRDRLVADPALIPRIVDECLRIEAPIIGVGRTVRYDTTLAGQPVHQGDRVLLVLSAANHDPAVFDRPDEFCTQARRNPHLAFGFGVHRCIGEHLALLEMRVVAEEVLRIAPDYRVADGFEPQWTYGGITRGLVALPVTFP